MLKRASACKAPASDCSTVAPWPYPFWIAHRGAGKLAPENTLAAFRLGASYGYQIFECDVKLSADDVPFLLHDDDLLRTVQTAGIAGDRPWSALSMLDAGSWHSAGFAGEPLPTLATIVRFIRANGFTVNLEIKPTQGVEHHTGRVVAQHVQQLWSGASAPPLLSSFKPEALAGAREVAPKLPRALLLDTFWEGWQAAAQALECVAVVCNHKRLDAESMALARQVVERVLVYTVNAPGDVQRMKALGVDGIITDAVDQHQPVV